MNQSLERKLAAIMFTDIAGYTEQMSKDQDLAFILLEEKQSTFKPLIKEHNGTLIKEMGDGTLSQYPTAVDASKCSVELQKLIQDNDKLNVRIGIHLGDTLFKDGDVFGDGVNIAARLESMSPAGGILVSKNVYDELLSRQGFEGVSLGLQSLKGVGRLVEVYALKDTHLTVPNPDDYKDTKVDVHTDDEVPSIAIIPFDNKGAEEDVFYAYGISADLISDCSGAGLIRVASKTDIEKLDYKNLDNTELSQKLLVRYIANGELWRMGDMFQLSIELYDTKDKKVLWSDRWQEKWDNLPTIKGSLSDGLLKALDTKPKIEQKIDTTNPEAYEFYLKAKHTYEKRENTNDTEIARGLLNKAIELDDNLISAKLLLGDSYREMGDYEKTIEIYTSTLKQAEKFGDKRGIGASLLYIGGLHSSKSDYEKALDYFKRSLAIAEELGDKTRIGMNLGNIGNVQADKGDYDKALDYYERSFTLAEELSEKEGMGCILNNIGLVHYEKCDYDEALDYFGRSFKIHEEIGNKFGLGMSLGFIGNVNSDKGDYDKGLDYYNRSLKIDKELGNKLGIGINLDGIGIGHNNKGDYNKALDYFERSLAIFEEIGDKGRMEESRTRIGIVHYDKGDYDEALKYLEKSLIIQKEIGLKKRESTTTLYLYLTYKHLGKQYDNKEIYVLIKDKKNIGYKINLRLYELLEEKSYLQTAYNQVQEKVDNLEPDVAAKFLSYPIPKEIVEEWEKG